MEVRREGDERRAEEFGITTAAAGEKRRRSFSVEFWTEVGFGSLA